MVAVGNLAPDFELYNQDGELVRLQDYQGKKVVLFTFPRAGTGDCTVQACTFRDAHDRFAENNTVVFGISSNSTDMLRIWRDKNDFPFDLLSDGSHEVLKKYGVWGQDVIGFIQIPAAKRSYWLIDEHGTICDMKIGVQPEEGIAEALAFVERDMQREK